MVLALGPPLFAMMDAAKAQDDAAPHVDPVPHNAPTTAPPIDPTANIDIAVNAVIGQGNDWPAGTVRAQLERDPTLVPFGKGAVFVPSMTTGLDEPPVTVYRGEELIAESTTGKRIIVSPGEYRVQLGSGAVLQQMKVDVQVREGNTTVIPVSWSGLSIHVVTQTYASLRASYELIRMEDRQYIGIGFGTDEQAGEPVSTWILKPGLYKVVRVGDNYRARTDFSTVRVLPGAHTHYILVLDENTNAFQGAGEISEAEIFKPRNTVSASLVLGGNVSLTSRSNVLNQPAGESYAASAFLDGRLNFLIAHNPLLLRLQVEEGQGKLPNLPWQKTRDRLALDALYIYRWKPWIGPYVRFGAQTNLFDSYRYFDNDDPPVVNVFDSQGQLLSTSLVGERLRTAPPFGLTTFREGVGVNTRVIKTLFAEMNFRVGPGARHTITRHLLVEDNPNSSGRTSADFSHVASDSTYGIEATVLGIARITNFVIINLELDTLTPFSQSDSAIIDLSSTVALKLTQFASVNYVIDFLRNRNVSARDQVEHDILLRFSVAVP
jgi:hypothetical protein